MIFLSCNLLNVQKRLHSIMYFPILLVIKRKQLTLAAEVGVSHLCKLLPNVLVLSITFNHSHQEANTPHTSLREQGLHHQHRPYRANSAISEYNITSYAFTKDRKVPYCPFRIWFSVRVIFLFWFCILYLVCIPTKLFCTFLKKKQIVYIQIAA